MTLDEAKKVAQICSKADSGCPNCVESLANELNVVFSRFTWAYKYVNVNLRTTAMPEPKIRVKRKK